MAVALSFRDARLRKALEVAPVELLRQMRIAMEEVLQDVEARLIQEQLSGRPGLESRTGTLRRSWRPPGSGRVSGETLADLRGVLATSTPYARIQEYGGTVAPKKGPWLWIPGAARLTPAGVFRGWEGVDWSRTFRVPRSRGAGYVVLARKGDGVDHVATLVPSVEIPPRLGLRRTWDSHKPRSIARLRAAVSITLAQSVR